MRLNETCNEGTLFALCAVDEKDELALKYDAGIYAEDAIAELFGRILERASVAMRICGKNEVYFKQ